MRPVNKLSGSWDPNRRAIYFKWDAGSIGNDRYIYIVGLVEENGTYRIDFSQHKLFDVCDVKNPDPASTHMPISNLRLGVYKMTFCVYSMPNAATLGEEEIIAACKSDPAFITNVMMGRATVSYVAEGSVAENAKMVKFYLKSDSDIAEGVLGYKYLLENAEVVSAFPGIIARGKTAFPPILIPKDAEVQIVPLDRQFIGNISVTAKKSKFLL